MRSGVSQGNFLFRAPPEFHAAKDPKKGYWVDLADDSGAAIRLRITEVAVGDLNKAPETLAQARKAEYAKGREGKAEVEGERDRARVTLEGLTVLLVRDGSRLYELFLEGSDKLAKVADGFSILDPKGAPAVRRVTPEDLKAKKLEHDYYRLKLLKPAGFTREEVDPNTEPGIVFHLRAEDEAKNLCIVKIRVFLARTLKKTLEERAQAALERFAGRYTSPRVPKRPKRIGWAGSKHAFQLKMSGKLPRTGLVVQEDFRFVDHTNGRVYEIQMTTYAGAQRAFKKGISAFWRSFKIESK